MQRRTFVTATAATAATLAAPMLRAQTLPAGPVRASSWASRPAAAPTRWRGWWA